MRKHVIIDCDPGIDDTMALAIAANSDVLNIVGLTTVFGNNTLEATTKNALILKEWFGLECEVYKGADKPLFHAKRAHGDFHGPNGMGGVQFNEPQATLSTCYAWDAIYREALKHQGELSLITLGPLTNVAIALLKYEDLSQYIKEIILMGGTAHVGNELPFSEANIVSDPYAMQAVVDSGIPITMVGLNATETTRLSDEEYNRLIESNEKLSPAIRKMFAHYKKVQNKFETSGVVVHDAAAMFVALYPDYATSTMYNVDVELTRNSMFGRTIIDIRKHSELKKNCRVVFTIDKNKYLQEFVAALEKVGYHE